MSADDIARKLRIDLAVSLKNQQSDEFLAIITSALREYGELVKQRAADLTFKRTGYAADAAAIETMPLP